MDISQVDYMVIDFPGNRFRSDEVAPELGRLVSQGCLHILDLAFIRKDEQGQLSIVELDALDPQDARAFADIEGEVSGLLSDEDLALMGHELPTGSMAAIVVWENTWMRPLTTRIERAGGTVVAHEHIPGPIVERDLAAIGS